MKRGRKLSALFIALVAITTLVATSGVALAGWVWCGDPIVDIGTPGSPATRVNIKFSQLDGSAAVNIKLPTGAVGSTFDAEGSTVTWGTDGDLKINREKIAARITVSVPRSTTIEKYAVQVSVNGRVIGEKHGRTGETLSLKVEIPRSR